MNSNQNPRTLLFVPGNQPSMLRKAAGFNIEWLIPDLEDSVPAAEKIEARAIVTENIPALAAAGKRLVPRVNSLASGLAEDDIAAIVSLDVIGISIGKISTPEDVGVVEKIVAAAEQNAGITVGHTSIVPWLETAEAVINAYEICKASERIQWVAFGAEDFSADMGITRIADRAADSTGAEEEFGSASTAEPGLTYARSAVAVAARAAGVHALDTPFTKFRDTEGLRAEAMLAKSIGYKGKLAIHPTQVEVIESVFMPTGAEIEHARKVLDIAAEAEADGRGTASLDGVMIDMPVILRAQNVLR
ncbi:MAG: citrate lyase subunit beta, partial [Chloroflexi bacterium]|nr:citrate lyase subunit beta [Chloroflexota bacterium]